MKYLVKNRDIHLAFTDLEKMCFDRKLHSVIFLILRKLTVDILLLRIIQAMYKDEVN